VIGFMIVILALAPAGYDAPGGRKIVVDPGSVVDSVHDNPPDPPPSPNQPQ
jgi:hypothetical protein